jgi:MFS family permease
MSGMALANPGRRKDAWLVAGAKQQLRESGTAFKSVWDNKDLRRLETSLTVWSLGGWGYSIAVSVYAFDVAGGGQRGAAAVGLMWLIRMVPSALLAPLAGVVGDRWSRRTVLLTSDLLRFCVLGIATLAVWQDWPSIIVYVAAAVNAVLATPFLAASAALLPKLANTPVELTAANAVSGIIDNVGFFAGPALAGVVLAATNIETAFLMTTLVTLVSFALNVGLPRDVVQKEEAAREETPTGAMDRFWSDALAGFKAIGSDSRLAVLLGIFTATCLVAGIVEVLMISIAFNLLHLGNGAVGYLNAAFGVGAMVGVRRLSKPVIVGGLLFGAPILIAASPNRVTSLIALTVLGIGSPLVDVNCFSLLQRAVPEDILARVFGIVTLLWNGSIGVGAILAPALISGLGVRGALLASGLVVPVLVVLLWRPLQGIDAKATAPAADRLELLQRMAIFAPLPGTALESLASRLIPVEAAAGEVVIREGDEGDRFYAIAEGEVDVSAGGAHVNTLGPGDPLGEIALLRDVPRTATCTARTPVKLFALTRDDFLSAVSSHAASREAAEATVSTRLTGLASVGRVAVPLG